MQQRAGIRAGSWGTAFLTVAILLTGLLGAPPAAAEKTVYPATVTIKLKAAELPPDSPYAGEPGLVGFGRVSSPQPACVRQRPIIGLSETPLSTAPVEEHTGVVSDATGAWQGKPFPDLTQIPGYSSYRDAIRRGGLLVRARVARKRLGGGRICAAAISDYLKVKP